MDAIVEKGLNSLQWIVDYAPLIGLKRLADDPDMEGLDVLQAPMRLIYLHQLWPRKGETFTQVWPLLRFLFVVNYFSITGYLVAYYFYYIYYHPESMVLEELIENVIAIAVHITIYYTVYIIVAFNKNHSDLKDDLKDHSKFGKPPGMDEANRKANMFSYAYWIYAWIGTFVYSSQGLLEKSDCEASGTTSRSCGFLLALRFPFPLEKLWQFVVTWCVQTTSMILLLTSGVTVMVYLFSTVELVNAKIVHLKQRIMLLGKRPDLARHGIRYCVEYHVKVIEMCKKLNHSWGRFMLYHQMMCTIMLSLIGIQYLLTWDFKCIVHSTAWIISLSIPCYAGQRLLDESTEIPDAIYSCEWYNLDKATRKDLVFMLMSANRILNLNMDGYGPINLSIVGKVLNNIYSVLMLLYSTMTEE